MSVLSKSNSSNMETPSFYEFKKQASFFFKEKIKTARLALTDVTSAELLTEEAISGNPDARTLSSISKSAFELDDYGRIVGILHKRLDKFEKKNWRLSYNTLIILEHLLTHGPESVAAEFQADKDVIRQMGSFQYVDEKGFNWGISVRKKSEKILNFLEKGSLLKEEREKARKLTREIQGFGSLSFKSLSPSILVESSPIGKYGKCNSNFDRHENQEQGNQVLSVKGGDLVSEFVDKFENHSFVDTQEMKMYETQDSAKENLVPDKEEFHRWDNGVGESNLLLGGKREEFKNGVVADDYHPFDDVETETTASFLSR